MKMHLLAIILLVSKKSALRWLVHLGGPGLILLGVIDNSPIPLPGSMDVATILLAAHNRNMWIYYAMMATAGSVLGGYLTYRMARKGGKETLEKRFSKRKTARVYAIFERWGLVSVAIPAILPPPFPIVPMLLAAGAMQYSNQEVSGRSGRGARHSVHHSCLSRGALRTAHREAFRAVLLAYTYRPDRVLSAGRTLRPV